MQNKAAPEQPEAIEKPTIAIKTATKNWIKAFRGSLA